MSRVVADISMSLDGYVTGPSPDLEHGLGHGGEPLHDWAITSEDPVDADILRTSTAATGAVIMGRRLFDLIDSEHGWNDEMGYGAREAGAPAFFVVTHSPPETVRLTLDFTFVPGVPEAVESARQAAGDKEVVVMGGAEIVRQVVEAGLADELRIHLAPIVLGGGTPLFGSRRIPFTLAATVSSADATHLTYVPA